ncbi:MAG: hypothetical protein H6R10_2839 [Rhodocyclaceae bacterium]|nr:hypothetical protein [Rhodocyclaceae bacterium]
MKALVFVLVLANALFFAYTQGHFGRPENPDAGRVEQQLNPERIRVVARGEPPAGSETKKEVPAPEKEADAEKPVAEKTAAIETPGVAEKPTATEKPAAIEKPGQNACMLWSELSGSEANRLAGLLGEKFTDFEVVRRATPVEGAGWWVFIPPLPSKAEADKKAGELKRMGVTDYFVVQEAGPNRFAISLGVFSSESGANEHLTNLKAQGVRSARMGARLGKDALQAVEARGPANRLAALAAAAAATLPEIVSRQCK